MFHTDQRESSAPGMIANQPHVGLHTGPLKNPCRAGIIFVFTLIQLATPTKSRPNPQENTHFIAMNSASRVNEVEMMKRPR